LNPYNNTLRTSVSGEESSNLTAGQFEFSQGNGGKGQSWGKVINRDWYLDGMSLSVNNIGGSNTIIELYVNGQATGKTLTLIAGDNVAYQNFSSTDLLGSAGDYINFLTIQSGGATGGRVSAYLHHNGDDDNSSGGGGGTTPNLNADMDYTFSNYDTSAGGQTRVNFEIHRVSGASGFRIQFQNVNWTGISVQNPNGATFANIGGGIVEMYGTIQNVGEIVNAVLISTTGEGGTQNPTGNPPTAYSLIP